MSSELRELLRTRDGTSPFEPAGEAPPPPPEDDVRASFEAMERSVDALPERELGSPVLPCQKPSFEITLTDADGLPMADGRYVLTVPGQSPRSGRLDAGGSARFDDIDLDPADWNITAELETLEDGELVHHLALVTVASDGAPPEEPDEADLVHRWELPALWLST